MAKNKSTVIVITSGKGGVGKTTVTANLGSSLAQLGRRIALLDADFGLRNLDLLLGLENRIVYTAIEVIAGDCRLEQALVKDKRQPGLVLLPAAQSRTKESITAEEIKSVVNQLKDSFDYIFIDCPAGIEMGFRNAIAPAEEAIIVTTPEVSAVRDADRVIGLLEANGVKKIRLIVNRIKPEMVQAKDMMSVEDVLEILAVDLIGIVPDDSRVIVSSNKGEPLVLGHPTSLPALAFNNIARRIEGEQVPLIDFMAGEQGFFSRLRRFFTREL